MATSKEQRLLNLIIALSSTRHRLTRAQIRDTVEGYESAPDAADPDAAFERMFERDKDELRRMGVPIETVADSTHGDDIGYRIRPAESALPPLELSAAELAVVSIAADYWKDTALGSDAKHAVTKVASSAEHGPRVEMPFAGLATGSHTTVAALVQAAADRQAVRFEYSSASSGAATRTVEPWKVVLRGGVGYLIGFDRDREDSRIFRIGRIVGRVTVLGAEGAYEIPDEVPLGLLAGPGAVETAVIALRPESGHALRRRGRPQGASEGWDLVEIDFLHADALVSEVLALGGAARVVEPRDLAASVLRHADAALAVTGG